MKNILIIVLSVFTFAACKKGEELRPTVFPGFSGAGSEATWVVFRHTITDIAYVTSVLPLQSPPTTYTKFDSLYNVSRQREVSPVSYKFYSNGEIATIGKNAQNENVWIKQSTLKWELINGNADISKNMGSSWVRIATCFPDEEKMVVKIRKTFFGDNTTDKDKIVMEVYYNLFN